MKLWWSLLALAGAALVAGCLSQTDDAPTVVIDMTVGRYHYTPGSEEPISVPAGSNVILRVTSTDVTHGLAIEGIGVQDEIPAGKTVEIRFRAPAAGDYRIYCTVFCGSGHPAHKGVLHVA